MAATAVTSVSGLILSPQLWAAIVPVLATALGSGGRWISQLLRERSQRTVLSEFDALVKSRDNQASLRELQLIATQLSLCDTLYENAVSGSRTRWTGAYGLLFGGLILLDLPVLGGATNPGFDADAVDPALAIMLAFVAPFLGRWTSKLADSIWFERFQSKLDLLKQDDAKLRYGRYRRQAEQLFIERLYRDLLTPLSASLANANVTPAETVSGRKRLFGAASAPVAPARPAVATAREMPATTVATESPAAASAAAPGSVTIPLATEPGPDESSPQIDEPSPETDVATDRPRSWWNRW